VVSHLNTDGSVSYYYILYIVNLTGIGTNDALTFCIIPVKKLNFTKCHVRLLAMAKVVSTKCEYECQAMSLFCWCPLQHLIFYQVIAKLPKPQFAVGRIGDWGLGEDDLVSYFASSHFHRSYHAALARPTTILPIPQVQL
jgi:hypothetical protein